MQNYLEKYNFKQNLEEIFIYITLFDFCNLHCKYCTQQKKQLQFSDIDLLKLKELPRKFFQQYYQQLSFCIIKRIHFIIKGGQLFNNQFFNILQPHIINLFSQLNKLFDRQTIDFTIISNGIFDNQTNIRVFLNKVHSKIIFTYDPIDRFINDSTKNTFLNNLQYFSTNGYLTQINVLLTQKTITYYTNNIKQLKQLCQSYNIKAKLEYYTNSNNKEYILSQNLLTKFFSKALKNKWNEFCIDIQQLKSAIQNKKCNRTCNCQNRFDINSNGDIEKSCAIILSKQQNILNGLYKYRCMDCQHINYCPLHCWKLLNSNSFLLKNCFFKKLFK